MNPMSCCSTKGDTNPETNAPRCMDYNGPLGNGENDETGIQRHINFIGSDCFYAVAKGLCLDEHSNGKGGCYNTHGGKLCTEIIKKR